MIEPINLLPVVGIDMSNRSLKICLLYLKSLVVILEFLGINSNSNNIDENSLIIFINTTPVIAIDREIFINFGIIVKVSNSLTNCSIILDSVTGNICSFPKKYPFNMDDIQIKGRVNPIAINGKYVILFLSRYVLNKGDINNNVTINNKLNNSIIGIVGKTIFLLLILFSLTSLEMATGSPREHNVINRLNVGNIKE